VTSAPFDAGVELAIPSCVEAEFTMPTSVALRACSNEVSCDDVRNALRHAATLLKGVLQTREGQLQLAARVKHWVAAASVYLDAIVSRGQPSGCIALADFHVNCALAEVENLLGEIRSSHEILFIGRLQSAITAATDALWDELVLHERTS
jgi:hypothetical protein